MDKKTMVLVMPQEGLTEEEYYKIMDKMIEEAKDIIAETDDRIIPIGVNYGAHILNGCSGYDADYFLFPDEWGHSRYCRCMHTIACEYSIPRFYCWERIFTNEQLMRIVKDS